MPQPSNTKLLEAIQKNHEENVEFQAEVKTRLGAVEKQVIKTNGRVTSLERDKIERDAISKYQDKNPIIKRADNVSIKSVWLSDGGQKVFLAVAALITALSVYVAAKGGV